MNNNWHFLKIFLTSKNKGREVNRIRPVWQDAQIKIVEGCNSRCVTCDIWKSGEKREMTVEIYRKVIKELMKYGLKSVCLTGGEPLLHSQIEEICKITKENGLNLVIQTNGLILSKTIDKIGRYVDRVNVSIDGWGEANDKIRGVEGYFEIATKAIDKIRKEYPKIEVTVTSTITETNFDNMGKLLDWCAKRSVKWNCNLLCNSLYFFKNAKIDKLVVNKKKKEMVDFGEKIGKFMGKIEKEYVKDYLGGEAKQMPCVLGLLTVFVDWEGNLYSGCWALPPIGNLVECSSQNIVNSQRFKNRIIDMYKLKCPGCTCGYDQNLRINKFDQVITDKIIKKLKWKNTI